MPPPASKKPAQWPAWCPTPSCGRKEGRLLRCPGHLPPLALCRMFAARKKQRYWPFSMDCTGTEAHISSCKLGTQVLLDPVKNVTCENGLPAVVSCVPGQVFSPDGPSRFRKAYKPEVRTRAPAGRALVSTLPWGVGRGWHLREQAGTPRREGEWS